MFTRWARILTQLSVARRSLPEWVWFAPPSIGLDRRPRDLPESALTESCTCLYHSLGKTMPAIESVQNWRPGDDCLTWRDCEAGSWSEQQKLQIVRVPAATP